MRRIKLKTNLTKKQAAQWRTMLAKALMKEKRGTPLDKIDVELTQWHKEYESLMKEKLNFVKKI